MLVILNNYHLNIVYKNLYGHSNELKVKDYTNIL